MKKRIALCANGWNGENLDSFIGGLHSAFGEDEADLFVLNSHATYAQDSYIRRAENSIYLLPDYSFFDAVVLFGSGMNSDEAMTQILDKCREACVPVVVQGYDAEGFSSVTVDNYVGMKELCEHLIEKHHVKDVVFIAGPKDNADSNLRLKALRDALEGHGYQLPEENILYANWEGNVIYGYIMETYRDKGEKLPDAIVCANDQMAMFTLMFLEMAGKNLPEDVIVTGFDNLSEGRVYYPSLASVDQCYREQGIECAKLVQEVMDQRKLIRKSVVPCAAMPGESCGCMNCKNEAQIRRMLGHDAWHKHFVLENIQGRESHLEMCIMSNDEYENIQETIIEDFYATVGEETEDFHIYLNPQYKNLEYMNVQGKESTDAYYNPLMDVIGARTDGVISTQKVLITKELLLGYTGSGKGKIFIFNPLRIEKAVVGYMIMGYTETAFENRKYVEFSGRLNKTFEKYQSNIKLARLNEKLTELMQKDSLTNVKNRVAYDTYMTRMDNLISMGIEEDISVVMCDINNLKTINDSLGHDAGDVYIKNCCNLMCEIFKHSPVFRTGGDEFIIIISTADFAFRQKRLEEMRKRMESLSLSEISPLTKVSIATGMADYDSHIDKTLMDVVKRADALMYQNKAQMKEKQLL